MSEPREVKPEHPEDKLRQVLGYISTVRDSMRMQNWDVILHREIDDEEDAHARTWQDNNHTTLNIALGPELFDESPERIRNTIIHELIHAQHRDVNYLWDGCTTGNDDVPESQSRSWDVEYRTFMERFVSWVTQRIAEGDTVPPFVPGRRYKVREGCYLFGEHLA